MAGVATVHLVRFGPVRTEFLSPLARHLPEFLPCKTRLHQEQLDPDFAYDKARDQYCSTSMLFALESLVRNPDERMLGITELDLFIPILTFVFGEALLSRPAAVISLHRLHNALYGLPEDTDLLLQRLQTEAVHELGHTFGLVHCHDYACAMHASHSAEEIDLKGPGFCPECMHEIEIRSGG